MFRQTGDPFAPSQSKNGVNKPTLAPNDPFAPQPYVPPSNSFASANDPFSSNNSPFGSASRPPANRIVPSDPFAPPQPTRSHQPTQPPKHVLGDPFAASYNNNNNSSSIGERSQDVMMDSGATSNLAFQSNHHTPKTSPPQPKDPFAPQPAHEQHMQQQRTYEPPAPGSQLYLRSVPSELLDRDAIISHFASTFPPLQVQHVSIRKNRADATRSTAVVTFANEADATRGLQHNIFNNQELLLSVFRTAAERVFDRAGEPTNELLFSHIPEDQFSESSIRNLFNSLCPNSVTNVSTREKPTPHGAKRTAIITFVDVQSATTALKNLPSYRNMKLQVVFRQKPQHARASADGDAAPTSEKLLPDPFHSEDMDMDQGEALDGSKPREVTGNQRQKSYPGAIVYEPKQPSESDKGPSEQLKPTHKPPRHAKNERSDQRFDQQAKTAHSVDVDDLLEARQREMEELRKKIKDREEQNKRAKERRRREVAKESKPQHQKTKKKQEKEGSGESEWRKGERLNISDAVLLVGTCQMMCPQAEIDERTLQEEFSVFETSNGMFDPELAVKKYRRSAALCEQPAPEDVRPPEVLLRTMDHLKSICDTKADLTQIHHFVRDRTRSLRQDFTLQGLKDDTCIRIHEESVRFHILSAHRLCGFPIEKFSAKQNREQLDKCLISLREMYDWRREQKLPMSPNEPEMQSYYVLTHMTEPKKCVQLLSGFAPEVRRTVALEFAFKVVRAASKTNGNPATFFECVREAPYLTACLLHPLFTTVRANAILMMNDSYGMARSLDNVALSTLTKRLGFESDDEAAAFCKMFDLKITGGSSSSSNIEQNLLFPSHTHITDQQVRNVCTKWKARPAVLRIESKAKGLRPSTIISGKKGVAWKESRRATAYPKEIPSSFRKGLRERFVRRLELRQPSPEVPEKEEVVSHVNEGTAYAKASPVQPVGSPNRSHQLSQLGTDDVKGRDTSGQASKFGERIFVGSGEDSTPFSRKRSPSQLYEPTAATETGISPGINTAPKPKNKVRFSDVVYEEGSPSDNQPRSPKRLRTVNSILQTTTNQNQPFNTFNSNQSPTTFPSSSNAENRPNIINVQLQNTFNRMPPPTTNFFPSPSNTLTKHQPNTNIAHSIIAPNPKVPIFHSNQFQSFPTEGQVESQTAASPIQATIVHPSHTPLAQPSTPQTPPINKTIQRVMIDTQPQDPPHEDPPHQDPPHQHAPPEDEASDVMSNDKNVETSDGGMSGIRQFISEIEKCISQMEESINKMRKRTYMSVDIYTLEHGECIRIFDCIREVTGLANTGLERLRRTGSTGEHPNENLFMKARAMLVPALRQASMQWDQVKNIFIEAVSQLQTVQLKLIQVPVENERSMLYALEPTHGVNLEKPKLLKEMRISRATASGTHRCPPPRLNELTDLGIEVFRRNVRCWKTCILNISGMQTTISNRWVQLRLTGWFNKAPGNKLLKLLELEPGATSSSKSLSTSLPGGKATDRYVSVMSGSKPGDIPSTTNAVVVTIDVYSDDDENKKSLRRLRETADSLKKQAEETDTQMPSIIVVYNNDIVNKQFSFDAQLRMELSRGMKEGSIDVVDVVKLGREEVTSLKMNAPFRSALLTSVLRTSRWEYRKGLNLRSTNVFDQLVERADFAWKRLMTECNPMVNVNIMNMAVINSINQAWCNVRLEIKEQEARWPIEVKRRRELTELRGRIEHLKLPTPQELNVDSTGEYVEQIITKIGNVDRVEDLKLDYDNIEVHPVWQFCLALQALIPSFIKKSLGDTHKKMVVPLPIGNLSMEELNLQMRVQSSFQQQDRRYLGVLKAKRRTSTESWAQSLRDSLAGRDSLLRSIGDRGDSQHGQAAADETGWERIRLPVPQLSWKGHWGQQSTTVRPWANRRSSIGDEVTRAQMRMMYDELIHEEEEYGKLLDRTMMEMYERARLQHINGGIGDQSRRETL